MISDLTDNESLKNKILGFGGLYLLLALGAYMVSVNRHPDMLLIQTFLAIWTMFSLLLLFKLDKLREIIAVVTFSQIVGTLAVFFYYKYSLGNILGFTPIDALKYSNIAEATSGMSAQQAMEYIRYVYHWDQSDLGFPLFLRLVYRLGGDWETSVFIMKFVNIALHAISLIPLYFLSRNYLSEKLSKYVVILWGVFPLTTYFNSSGLKESLFAVCAIFAVYYVIEFLKKISLKNLLLMVLFTAMIIFFRIYVVFFILIGIGAYYVLKIRNRALKVGVMLTFAAVFIGLLVFAQHAIRSVTVIDYAALATKQLGSGNEGLASYLVISLGAIWGPLPQFVHKIGGEKQLIYSFALYFKVIISYFAVWGMYKAVRLNNVKLIPIVVLIACNTLMTIVAVAGLDPRFQYPIYPFYMLFTVYGIVNLKSGSRNNRLIYAAYLVCMFALIALYNVRDF